MKTYTKKARKGRLTLKNMVLSAMMAAVLCVLAPLAIPVPAAATQITLATFAVYLSATSLTTFQSVSSVFIYILLGAVGLPVFAGFSGGVGAIAGPTGGYIIGYLFCAAAAGLIINRFTRRFFMYPVALIIGTFLCYTCGTIWFVIMTGNGLAAALVMCVLPFIPADIVKIIVAAAAGFRLRKLLSINHIN